MIWSLALGAIIWLCPSVAAQELQTPELGVPPRSLSDGLPAPLELQTITRPTGSALNVTVEQAIELAWSQNLEIKAADTRIAQAFYTGKANASQPATQINLATMHGQGAAYTNANYNQDVRGDYFVQLSQNFLPFGSRKTLEQLGGHRVQVALEQARALRVKIAQDVKGQFYNLLAAQLQVRIAEENLQLAEKVREIARKRFEVGQGPRLDFTNADIQRNRAEQDWVTADSSVSQTQAKLLPLLGYQCNLKLAAVGDFRAIPDEMVIEDLAKQLEEHPRILALKQSLAVSRLETQSQEQQGRPSPFFSAIYDIVAPSYSLQVGLSFPLDWGQIGHELESKRHRELESRYNLEKERLSLDSELQIAYRSYIAARKNQLAYLEKVLQPAEEVAKTNEFGYRKGAIPYLQLLSAQQMVSTIRKEYLDRQLSVQLALNDLEASIGRQLERKRETPP